MPTRSIVLINAKGGSGKTTLACNIAAYYAIEGYKVALVDCDRQASALDWLEDRPEDRAPIAGYDGTGRSFSVPRGKDYVIMDAPAATHGAALEHLLSHVQTAIIPVIPSPVDLNAAEGFLDELVEVGRVLKNRVRVATVANRVRENSPGRYELEDFLGSLKLPDGRKMPFVAMLRNTQNYVNAAERGLSIFEIAPSRAEHDLELWKTLTRWLNSKNSLPR
ncbi:MAG TPA: ParA family protein [Gammaproteobacteria bacterium]|jgi:chromosome partitioning protein